MDHAQTDREHEPGKRRCRTCPTSDRRCEQCRERDRRNQFLHRVRKGEVPMRKCFRCLTVHPYGSKGEQYCFLSAEWIGWPWRRNRRALPIAFVPRWSASATGFREARKQPCRGAVKSIK
jgi:hypothetical protein